MNPFFSELIGTMIMIILGNGVVANVVLPKTKGNASGLLVIATGWAIAVFTGAYVASHGSKAHLNPAITIAMAAFSDFSWEEVPVYIAGQFAGALIGALVVWITFRQHFDETNETTLKLAVFSTSPAIRHSVNNFITELVGTFVLVFGILFMTKSSSSLGSLDSLPVTLLVLGIGLSLGGPTGYAINPARDLGPRIMHAILPIKNKGNSDWGYSWIPVLAPIVGGLLAGFIFKTFIHLT